MVLSLLGVLVLNPFPLTSGGTFISWNSQDLTAEQVSFVWFVFSLHLNFYETLFSQADEVCVSVGGA